MMLSIFLLHACVHVYGGRDISVPQHVFEDQRTKLPLLIKWVLEIQVGLSGRHLYLLSHLTNLSLKMLSLHIYLTKKELCLKLLKLVTPYQT